MKDIINKKIKENNIDKKLKDLLYYKDCQFLSIEWGINYILFSPSKRVRPLLLIETNKIFSTPDDDSYILAASIELIHTYSLVHDDLPCMDDDELRRGVRTLHTIKNEAYALLVGDSLLTRAFGILSKYSKYEKINEILNLIYTKIGEQGMILGQYLDIESEDKRIDISEITRINKHKTANLIELSMLLGAINGGAEKKYLEIIENLAECLGHIFQIKDDILDIEGDTEIIGKPQGSDKKNKKSSIVNILGLEKAKEELSNYKRRAFKIIEKIATNKEFFFEFTQFLVDRNK